MKSNLANALSFIFKDEGGFAQRATEPGGAVNMGVSMAAFAAWRTSQKKPRPSIADLKAMTQAEATMIYETNYAAHIGFNGLPPGLDYAALDAAVNEGVGAAQGLLTITLPLANNVKARIQAISGIRLLVKEARPEWAQFGPGWTKRIGVNVISRANAMVSK
jgi:lysozyme family protein